MCPSGGVCPLTQFGAGRGTLQQIGLLTPSPTLVVFLTLLFGGATVFAFGRTLKRALTKDMSPTCATPVAMLPCFHARKQGSPDAVIRTLSPRRPSCMPAHQLAGAATAAPLSHSVTQAVKC